MLNTLWSTPDHIPINKCRDPMKETASERVETHLPWKQDPPHTHPAPSSGIVYRMSLRRHCGRAPCTVGASTRAERSGVEYRLHLRRTRNTPSRPRPPRSLPIDRSLTAGLCNIKAPVSTDTHYSVAAFAARQSPVTVTVFIDQRIPLLNWHSCGHRQDLLGWHCRI